MRASYTALRTEEDETERSSKCKIKGVLFVFLLCCGSSLNYAYFKGYDVRRWFSSLNLLDSLRKDYGSPIEEEPVFGEFRDEGQEYIVNNDFHGIGSLSNMLAPNSIINQHGHHETTMDYGQTCRITIAPKGYLTGWKYKIDSVLPDCTEVKETNKRCGIVHHMNLYGIKSMDAFVEDRSAIPDWCMRHPGKLYPVANYDRGAVAFSFPEGYGVNLNPFTHLLVETHYLLPSHWAPDEKGFADKSGYTLYVSDRVEESVSMYGFVNRDMELPKHRKNFDFVSRAGADIPLSRFWRDKPNQTVKVVAIHQHHHDLARKKWVEVKDRTGKTKYKTKIEEVSPEDLSTESWKYISKMSLEPGDKLSMHCLYETSNVDYIVKYGLGNTDEMCGAVFYANIDMKDAVPISEAWYSREESLADIDIGI